MSKAQIMFCLEQITKESCNGCPLAGENKFCLPEPNISCEVAMLSWLLEDITPEHFIRDYVVTLPHDFIHDCFMMGDDIDRVPKHFAIRMAAITEDIRNVHESMTKGTCPDPADLCDWIRDELKQEYEYLEYKKNERGKKKD